MPKPGEIWMIQRDVSALVSSCLLDLNCFSEPASHFIQGYGPSRYVMIVGDPRLLSEYSMALDLNPSTPKVGLNKDIGDDFLVDLMDQYWVSVMVLGNDQNRINLDHQSGVKQTRNLSSVDVLIPPYFSGLDCNVIAETWHIVPMLVNQLSCPVGHRFSSTLYNHLMDIGDAALGKDFTMGKHLLPLNQLQSFHQEEQQWSEVLRFPITACHMQLELLERTTSIMDRAIWLERFSPQ